MADSPAPVFQGDAWASCGTEKRRRSSMRSSTGKRQIAANRLRSLDNAECEAGLRELGRIWACLQQTNRRLQIEAHELRKDAGKMATGFRIGLGGLIAAGVAMLAFGFAPRDLLTTEVGRGRRARQPRPLRLGAPGLEPRASRDADRPAQPRWASEVAARRSSGPHRRLDRRGADPAQRTHEPYIRHPEPATLTGLTAAALVLQRVCPAPQSRQTSSIWAK